MPSYYDQEKKCRVGTMDEAQFDKECDKENAECFKLMLKDWTKAGGILKWGAGGVGLRCKIDGKEVGVCFLAPQYTTKKDRIELSCTALTKANRAGAHRATCRCHKIGRRRAGSRQDDDQHCPAGNVACGQAESAGQGFPEFAVIDVEGNNLEAVALVDCRPEE